MGQFSSGLEVFLFLHKATCIVMVVHKEAHKTRGQSCVAGRFQKHCSSSELNMCGLCLQVKF